MLRRGSGRTCDPKKGMWLSSALKTLAMVRQPRRMASRMSVVLTSRTPATALPNHAAASLGAGSVPTAGSARRT